MTTSIVLTVVGDDRPGIVEILSDVLMRHGGNWVESSMSNLAGKFAGVMRAQVASDAIEQLQADFAGLKDQGLQVIVEVAAGAAASDCIQVNLQLVGDDRPGIVRQITQVLARHGINVESLATRAEDAPMSGELLFYADAELKVPVTADLDQVREELEGLANELMADIKLDD